MPDERPGRHGATDVYKGFIDAVNRQDLEAAERFVDPERYRENCVGFTHGFVRWDVAKQSIRQVWKGIPDLHVDLPQIMADGDVVVAHGTVSGTATGRLYGAPATKRHYEANFFDFVRVDDARIVERIQQADVLGQMRQLYGKGLGTVGLAAMFWRLLSPAAGHRPSRAAPGARLSPGADSARSGRSPGGVEVRAGRVSGGQLLAASPPAGSTPG